jgi:hypothetical protein
MEHAVFYPGPDGAPAFRRFSSLDEAVRFVEHMRNVEGVEDVSVEMLTPVALAFRAYYRVEMPVADAVVPEQAEATLAELLPVEAVPVEPALAEVPEPAEPDPAANGKRSLGFFAH